MIAATNRDLRADLESGAFRRDFCYRLCTATLRTPPLAEQLAQAPHDLYAFVEHILERVLGGSDGAAGQELQALCGQTVASIRN